MLIQTQCFIMSFTSKIQDLGVLLNAQASESMLAVSWPHARINHQNIPQYSGEGLAACKAFMVSLCRGETSSNTWEYNIVPDFKLSIITPTESSSPPYHYSHCTSKPCLLLSNSPPCGLKCKTVTWQLQISTIYSYYDEIYLLGELCQTNTVEQYGLSELRQSKLI